MFFQWVGSFKARGEWLSIIGSRRLFIKCERRRLSPRFLCVIITAKPIKQRKRVERERVLSLSIRTRNNRCPILREDDRTDVFEIHRSLDTSSHLFSPSWWCSKVRDRRSHVRHFVNINRKRNSRLEAWRYWLWRHSFSPNIDICRHIFFGNKSSIKRKARVEYVDTFIMSSSSSSSIKSLNSTNVEKMLK